jgi:hypothetical protein
VALCFHAQNCLSNLGAEVLTDPQGRFEIKAIPPVLNGFDYRISVNAAGFGPKEYERIKPEGKAGTTVDVGTIALPLADQTVSGVVVDANGAPASYVPIFINGLAGEIDHPSKSTATNDRGEFTITRLCKGVIRLQANFSSSPGGQGFIRTQVPSQPVKIVLGKDLTQMPDTSILSKVLPNLADLSKDLSEVKADNKPILLCLVDIEQRPSRRCLSDLAKKAGALADKGVSVVLVQTSKVDLKQYNDFLKANSIGFPIYMVDGDFGAKKAQWGVKALPWLILADKGHVVHAEGFSVSELEAKVHEIKE